ncbi:MAG: CRTAC1 family protein, partial [Bdellovibrionales bacterium]|nr:CRTAC1 family protein [Bdellovibrionales bacterium]
DAEPSHTKPLPNGFPPVTGFKLEASESQLNFEVVANRDLSVQLRKLQPRQEPIKSGQFEIIKGSKLGLVDSIFQSSDLVRPFSRGLGISSCDLNDDGWSDLVAAYPDGVRLYKNLGTEGFQEFHWPTEAFDNRKPLVVSCIDIDNDGKLDVWVGCSGGENFVSFQVVDGYMESPKRLIKFDQQPLTPAIAFSDIDSDGRLDIVAGGWTSAFPLRRNLSSLNRLYKNKFPEFIEVEDFFNFVGETLSILITTLAAKSEKQFLYVGNDYEAPDQLAFVGRNFSKKAAQLGVQTTPYHTMSIDSADIDNDLDFDLFATDLSFQDLRFGGYCELAGSHSTQSCDFLAEMAAGYDILDFAVCESTKSKSLRQMCINAMLSLSAERYKDPTYCNLISSSVEAGAMKTLCRKQASRSGQDGKIDDQGFRQVSSNHFYLQSDDGSLKESTREFQLLDSKYAWNAKFHDFDNDGFQDLFVVNGTFYNKGYSSNQLFLNQGGRLFRSVGVSASKLNMQHASTFTVADFDNDGDLDIIVAGVNSSFKYYQNRSADDSFVVELRDKVLNSRAIGARAVLAYRVKGEIQKQVREVKMSGGYMSYDSNLLHFGISGSKEVAGVEITWSDGSSSSVEGPFPTNSHLKITRSY